MNKLPMLALLLAAAPALAQNFPARQPGLWEQTMQMPGMPGPMTAQSCVDAAKDAEMMRRGMQQDPAQKCTQKSSKRLADGYEFEAECESAEGKTLMRTRLTGDFAKAYTMDSTMRFEPPRQGRTELTMKSTAKHMGACPAGMAPGEVRMTGMPGMGGERKDRKQRPPPTPEQIQQMTEQMKKAMPPKP